MSIALSMVSVPFDYESAGFESIDDLIQPVYKAVDKIEPTEAEMQSGVLITDYGKGLNHPQTIFLGQEISKKVGSRYIPFSLQTSYNRFHSDAAYKEHLTYRWNHNSHLLLEETTTHKSGVIAIPEIELKEDQVLYAGELKEVPVKDGNKVIDILERADIFKGSGHKIYNSGVHFDSKGLSSVGSGWYWDGGCFGAGSGGPSGRGGGGLASFELLAVDSESTHRSAEAEHEPKGQSLEPKKREITQEDLEEENRQRLLRKLRVVDKSRR